MFSSSSRLILWLLDCVIIWACSPLLRWEQNNSGMYRLSQIFPVSLHKYKSRLWAFNVLTTQGLNLMDIDEENWILIPSYATVRYDLIFSGSRLKCWYVALFTSEAFLSLSFSLGAEKHVQVHFYVQTCVHLPLYICMPNLNTRHIKAFYEKNVLYYYP